MILILTPFRNEDHSIPQYMQALKNLTYPHVEAYWLENDSMDDTLELLEEYRPQMDFPVTLESVSLLKKQPVKKKPGRYWKDIPYMVKRRGDAWLKIWNDYFLPIVRESTCEYVLIWFADAIPPSNVIEEFLDVFKLKPDAGWVGGQCHRRHPREDELNSPNPRYVIKSGEIEKVRITAHVWMCPRKALAKCRFRRLPRVTDMHFSLVRDLENQGLSVYYQPSVYIKHISTDGKIYRTEGVTEY